MNYDNYDNCNKQALVSYVASEWGSVKNVEVGVTHRYVITF